MFIIKNNGKKTKKVTLPNSRIKIYTEVGYFWDRSLIDIEKKIINHLFLFYLYFSNLINIE